MSFISKKPNNSIACSLASFSAALYPKPCVNEEIKFDFILLCSPIFTLSRTDIFENKRMFWNVLAIPSLFTCAVVFPAVSVPFSIIEPLVGWYTFVRRLKIVVFPAPLGPISPHISVLPTVTEKLSTAVRPPKSIPSC
ncbi:hypothetical protein SDC9_78896 [bioreactor metagenome]|uniref:Uncharacterized protein n=1 Tax=bioreactor metagenome TaxID=1076179 RepID=A0A644Z2E4_9ZZZZ